MKKIISVLAMALLVIGAAQAQNQVRKMVVRTTDGEVVKYNTENVEDVTFELVSYSIPTTVEEAETMLVGYWKGDLELFDEVYMTEGSLPSFVKGIYFAITEDLKVYIVFKIADTVTDNDWATYAGKYVVFDDYYVTVNSEDPTMVITPEGPGQDMNAYTHISNLTENSFEYHTMWNTLAVPFERVEPFEYIFMNDGLMKDGLMKK